MQQINKEEIQKRLDQITELFAAIVTHADRQASRRCPYRNRLNHCTAGFGCRNKRKPLSGGSPVCSGDEKLDYRAAWED